MPQTLDNLYNIYYKKPNLLTLNKSIEENHKILIKNLSKEDRKVVLKVIDALSMICNYQTQDSFTQGIKLGVELTTKLQNYNDHSFESDELKNCGLSFMPTYGEKES